MESLSQFNSLTPYIISTDCRFSKIEKDGGVTSENRFKCHICRKTFTTKQILVNHERIHLVRHRLIHNEKKDLKCDICRKTFTQKCHLDVHKRIHTRGKRKTYPCKVCKKSFSQKGYLKSHMTVHTGEKSHQCKVCEKSFSQKGNLKSHMTVHTGEKPNQCKVCKKTFREKVSLDRHMVVHTGEKPYSCDKCRLSYANPSGLYRHKKKCMRQSSLQQNEIQFVDCGETIKQEIKEENNTGDEINTLEDPLTVNSEHCQDIVVSSEISLESELEAESIDCKETIKLEIK